MLKKAFARCGKNRVHKTRGEIIVPDGGALFSRTIEEIGDQLRLDFSAPKSIATTQWADAANVFTGELHVQRITANEIRKLGRANVHRIALNSVLTKRVFVRLQAIAGALQIAGEFFRADRLPDGDVLGRGEDLRGVLQNM